MERISPFLKYWRVVRSRQTEIVDAVVLPEHVGPSADLKEALDSYKGIHYWSDGDAPEGHRRLTLLRETGTRKAEAWLLHLVLFTATFLTMLLAGSLLARGRPPTLLRGDDPTFQESIAHLAGQLEPGLSFAAALMAILLAHEMGHYILARRYRIDASPPYFLPAPPFAWLNFIGTFGAFIRIRSPIADRRQLLEVGAAGPWFGFVIAVGCMVWGMQQSIELPGQPYETAMAIEFGRIRMSLGDSLLLGALRDMLGISGSLLLHPVAFAGWLGLFVTALNLMPLGQLDGGHVLYSLLGDKQRWVGVASWWALIYMGFKFEFVGWLIWGAIALLLGRGRLAHPSVLDPHRPVPAGRKLVGWVTMALFVITFTPLPFVF